MGTMTLWDRIWPWLRHPLSTSAAAIAFRYCENHGLAIHWADSGAGPLTKMPPPGID